MGRNEFADESLETTVMGRYPKPGTLLLGKYLVVSLIGTGGMGVVLKCKHIQLEEFVAIKCLLPEMMERKEIVQRFLREAKAAVKLKGEHVARVHDVGRFPDNDVPYIVMEYLEGADLNAIIKHHGAQDPAIAVDLILQACEAIAEAHSLGIIHRDIKASNFFITQPPNQSPVLKVLDFGIATSPEGTSDLTSTQSVIGTPSYMAPEQMRSSKDVDQRSDIWSIGVVLYELLEGSRPFRSDVYSELCLKVGMDPPQPMVQPEVPDGLRAIVLKCLEKPVERRYQSVAELAFDLMPFASDAVAARAAVEQTARLLGRRGAQDHNDARRQTPAGAFQSTPISTSQPQLPSLEQSQQEVATVLGRPTPRPTGSPKTPTSIGASSGEVQSISQVSVVQSIKPRRSGLVVAITTITVLALAGGGAFLASSQGWFDKEKPSASQPPAPPEERVEPIEAVRPEAKPETTTPETTTPDTAKPGDKGNTPSAGSPTAGTPTKPGDKPATPGAGTPTKPGDKPATTGNEKLVVKQPVVIKQPVKQPVVIKQPVKQPVIVKQPVKQPVTPVKPPEDDLYNRRR